MSQNDNNIDDGTIPENRGAGRDDWNTGEYRRLADVLED